MGHKITVPPNPLSLLSQSMVVVKIVMLKHNGGLLLFIPIPYYVHAIRTVPFLVDDPRLPRHCEEDMQSGLLDQSAIDVKRELEIAKI
jgi:hypothetical protein